MKLDLISSVAFAIFVFILVQTVLSGLVSVVSGLFRRRSRLDEMVAQAGKTQPVGQVDLLSLAHIPWMQFYILGAAVGFGLFLVTHQVMAVAVSIIPLGVKIWLTSQRKRELNGDALSFLTDLRLAIPFQGSLLLALREVAKHKDTRLASVVHSYFQAGWNGSGLALLEKLAAETSVAALADLVAWTKAAEDGTLGTDAPFENALTRLQAETRTAALENLQRIPTRLTMLVFPALLGPIIVLLLYPVAARLLASISGGMGSGF